MRPNRVSTFASVSTLSLQDEAQRLTVNFDKRWTNPKRQQLSSVQLAFWALIINIDCTETDSYSLIERTNVGPSSDRDHSGSAALLEADSASEEDASGLAADGQEEGKDEGKGKTKLFALLQFRVLVRLAGEDEAEARRFFQGEGSDEAHTRTH